MNFSDWKRDFDKYLASRLPNINDYQYIDDYISDCVEYKKVVDRVAKKYSNWYTMRVFRHELVEKALALGMSWRMPANEKQYQKEVESGHGI